MHKAKPKQAYCLPGLRPTSTHSGYGGYFLAIVAPPFSMPGDPFPTCVFGAPLLRDHYCPIMTLMSNTILPFIRIFDNKHTFEMNSYKCRFPFTSHTSFSLPLYELPKKRKNRVDCCLQISRMASWKTQIILQW